MAPKETVPSSKFAEYSVGWICALPGELAAARDMLDVEHGVPERRAADDGNTYLSTGYSPAPSNFLIFSYFLFSYFLFLNIPVFSMSLLHCSRYFQTVLFFSLSHVCL